MSRNWVASKGGDEAVRGLVVAAVVDRPMLDRLDTLARADGRRIDWMEYRVELELKPVLSASGDESPSQSSRLDVFSSPPLVRSADSLHG